MSDSTSVTLCIAGIRFRLRGSVESVRKAVRRYAPYRSLGRPDLLLEWTEGDPPRTRTWPRPRVEGNGRGPWIVSRRDFHCVVEGGRGSAVTTPEATALDSLLRVLLSEIVAARGGVLAHSAAVDGFAFPGASESGKTTLASLAPRTRVLSDELVAFVPRPRGFEVCATPFWGSFVRGSSTARAPLRAVFFLDRRRREEIVPLPPGAAAARLLRCALCFRNDGGAGGRLLENAARVVTAVPCFRLSYDAAKTGYRELEGRLTAALQGKGSDGRS